MKKHIIPGTLIALLFPTFAMATSYNMELVKIFLLISILDEMVLFGILPLLIIILLIRIIKYKKTISENPLKERRKVKIYKTLLAITLFFALWIVLPKQSGSEPCGFNMMSSCTVTFKTMINRLGIGKPDLSSTKCPSTMVAVASKGRPICVSESSAYLYK